MSKVNCFVWYSQVLISAILGVSPQSTFAQGFRTFLCGLVLGRSDLLLEQITRLFFAPAAAAPLRPAAQQQSR